MHISCLLLSETHSFIRIFLIQFLVNTSANVTGIIYCTYDEKWRREVAREVVAADHRVGCKMFDASARRVSTRDSRVSRENVTQTNNGRWRVAGRRRGIGSSGAREKGILTPGIYDAIIYARAGRNITFSNHPLCPFFPRFYLFSLILVFPFPTL